jgi:hypothetical protein
MRPGGEQLRGPHEVSLPDPRMENVIVLTSNGGTRPYTLEDRHASLEDIRLQDSVPDDIWVHFEGAKNLLLYSWFVYRFKSVAELQALASLELALRERFRSKGGPVPKGLGGMLRKAISSKWVSAEQLSAYQKIEERRRERIESSTLPVLDQHQLSSPLNPRAYLDQIADAIPRLRNEWAHGSELLFGHSFEVLVLCADLINQLFPSNSAGTV